MRKVDFTKLPCDTVDGHIEEVNFSKVIGKVLFNLSEDPGEGKFSQKVWESEGEIEMSDYEESVLRKYMYCFKYVIQTGIARMLGIDIEKK